MSIEDPWDELCEEFEKSLFMVEYLIPNTLKHQWNLVKAEGDKLKKKADVYDSVEFVTKETLEGETLEIYHIDDLATAHDDKRNIERKLEAVKKVLHDEATWFSENKMKRDWLEEIKGILEG